MAIFSPEAVRAQAGALLCALAAAVQPPPDQTISQWAEGRVVIPGETGTENEGPVSFDGYEYLIEPLDRLGPDDPCRDVAFRGSAQIAKTTAGVLATLFYSSVMPRSWGVALPSDGEVLKYNRSKWQPLVDATPELKRKIRPVSRRDEQGSTNTYKRFSGGYGQFFGAGSPKALQMVTFCIVVYEETPNWETEVGGRGDPRGQIRMRQLRWEEAGAKTFHNATPGIQQEPEDGGTATGCPISEDYEKSDQRQFYLPCPHCADGEDGVLLRLDSDKMQGMGEGEHPHFNCPGCGCEITNRHKAAMKARCRPNYRGNGRAGGWLPTFPSESPDNPAPDWFVFARDFSKWRNRPLEGRQPGYDAWQVISSAVGWEYIAKANRDAEESGKEADKITFSQQVLGKPYRMKVQKAEVARMLEKRAGGLQRGVVPSGFEILTCAVDINGDWAQATAYAWGPGGAHVPVDRVRIDGSPGEAQLWKAITALRSQTYPHEEGGQLGFEAFGVDTGYGTVHVYAWANKYPNVRALDGEGGGWGLMPLRRGAIQKLKGPDGTVVRCRIWKVGTWDLKRELLNEAIPMALDNEAASRLPGKPIWPMWLERDYFDELTAEALVEKQDKKTGAIKPEVWVKIRRRNEEMDLWVYNKALAASLGIGIDGAEPNWLELARKRVAGQLELAALWDRPTPPAAPMTEESGAGGWDWRKRRT